MAVIPHPRIPHTCWGRGAKSIPSDPATLSIRSTGRIVVQPDGEVFFAGLDKSVTIGRVCYAPRVHVCDRGSDPCGSGWAPERPPHPVDQPIEHPCRGAAVLAAECVRGLSSDLSTALAFAWDVASATATLTVSHVSGGRGDLVIRAHHGYLYLDRGKSDGKIPSAIADAVREAVRAFSDLHGYRHP